MGRPANRRTGTDRHWPAAKGVNGSHAALRIGLGKPFGALAEWLRSGLREDDGRPNLVCDPRRPRWRGSPSTPVTTTRAGCGRTSRRRSIGFARASARPALIDSASQEARRARRRRADECPPPGRGARDPRARRPPHRDRAGLPDVDRPRPPPPARERARDRQHANRPGIGLPRLRAAQQLTELRASDLAFTSSEATRCSWVKARSS